MAWSHAESPLYYVAVVLSQQSQLLFRVAWIGPLEPHTSRVRSAGCQLPSLIPFLPGCLAQYFLVHSPTLRSAFSPWHTKYLGLANHVHTAHPHTCKPWGIIREVTVSGSMGMEGKCLLRRQSAEGSRGEVAGCGPGPGAGYIPHSSGAGALCDQS